MHLRVLTGVVVFWHLRQSFISKEQGKQRGDGMIVGSRKDVGVLQGGAVWGVEGLR